MAASYNKWRNGRSMGDVIDLEEYRKRRASDAAKVRDGKPARGRRRERKAPLSEPAERVEDGTDDDSED